MMVLITRYSDFQFFFLACSKDKMYANWEPQSSRIITSLNWYSVDHIVEYLHGIRSCIIYANRDIPHLSSLSVPANKEERFPKHICYLNESIGEWILKLDMINLLLYNKTDQSMFKSQGHADVQILSIIHQLLQSIESGKDTVTQSRFEARYGLIWIESDINNHDTMYCDNTICSCYKTLVLTASLLLQSIQKFYHYFFKQKYYF
jgi:hypothetical protein